MNVLGIDVGGTGIKGGVVDRDHVLRACGHDHYAIENCAQVRLHFH